MKIGVFGGTFNPVHYGHLINAQFIKEACSLDKILFIPSKYPVHKSLDGAVSADDRLHMIELAIKDNPGFDVTRIEIDRPEKSYTIITIKHLLRENPGALINLIIGADAFSEIDSWKDYNELSGMVSFIVMRRWDDRAFKKDIPGVVKNALFAENPIIEISSSIIREKIKKGLSIKYLVPQSVEDYILKKELYRN